MTYTRSIFYKTGPGPELTYWGEVTTDLRLAIKIAVRLLVRDRWWAVFLEPPSPHKWALGERRPYDYVATLEDWEAGRIDISAAEIDKALANAYLRQLRWDAAIAWVRAKKKVRALA